MGNNKEVWVIAHLKPEHDKSVSYSFNILLQTDNLLRHCVFYWFYSKVLIKKIESWLAGIVTSSHIFEYLPRPPLATILKLYRARSNYSILILFVANCTWNFFIIIFSYNTIFWFFWLKPDIYCPVTKQRSIQISILK